jgi:hypothetical protein
MEVRVHVIVSAGCEAIFRQTELPFREVLAT